MESAVEDDDGPPVETWWQRLPRRWLWCVVACLVITTGCGDGAGNEAPNRIPDLTRVIRPGEPVDSIGTEVRPEASSQRVRSFFDDADTLIVGELTDSAGLAFGEITDATASRNGVIYALDGSAKRVFVIDGHDGGHVQTVGRSGNGPGEFSLPVALALGDPERQMLVLDARGRMSVYRVQGPDGQLTENRPGPSRLAEPVRRR